MATRLDSLPAAPFADRGRAARNLERIAACVPAEALAAIGNLLSDSPDPDAALNHLERLCATASPELLALLNSHRELLHYALVVFGYSQYLGDTLLRNPDLFQALRRDRGFQRSHSADDFREALARYRSRSVASDLPLLLARFRRREYVRIMLRDVLGIGTLAETTGEISALADILIAEALREAQRELRQRYGAPRLQDAAGRWTEPAMAAIALGKLGGNELNYSSDVDLLFLYRDQGVEDPAAAISNREYFVRLAQRVTDMLSRATAEGAVFRIDLRLRPQGREGEPTIGLRHALDYYAQRAHDWELQALIKARHSAGDLAVTREFLRGVQPFVYREELNFAAIETALASREKISERRARSGRVGIDVKVGRGGIRDIEFLMQCLQRVYGGAEPWLRSGGTLFSIHKLHDKGHLSGRDFHELSTAYEFLRRLEHRLQLRRGQQTHRLPESQRDLEVLWRSLAREAPPDALAGPAADDPAAALVDAVRRRMSAVAEIYRRSIHQQQFKGAEAQQESEFRLSGSLAEIGAGHSFAALLGRVAADSPELYRFATQQPLSPFGRRNLERFLNAAFTSSERYAALLANPQALGVALELFEVSEFLTDVLVRHPQEIAALGEVADEDARGTQTEQIRGRVARVHTGAGGTQTESEAGERGGGRPRHTVLGGDTLLQLPRAAEEARPHDPVFEYLAGSELPYGEKLALLRRQHRRRVFLSGARDVTESRRVYDSLADTSSAALDALATAMRIAAAPAGMAVLSLGRLGTLEFDLGSDADLLFLRDEAADHAACVRAAERMVETLAAYTREGTVFSVDSRLRPRGVEGELVVTPAQLAAYFAEEAQPWEALSYTKLRYGAGAPAVAGRALTAVRDGMLRFTADRGFAAAVRTMRARLEREINGAGNGRSLKTAPGAFYDVDFIVSFLLVKHAAAGGQALSRGHTPEALADLRDRGALGPEDHAQLDSAAELLRSTDHAVRLVLGRPRSWLPAGDHARRAVQRLVARATARDFPRGLEEELRATMQRVREIYQRLTADDADDADLRG